MPNRRIDLRRDAFDRPQTTDQRVARITQLFQQGLVTELVARDTIQRLQMGNRIDSIETLQQEVPEPEFVRPEYGQGLLGAQQANNLLRSYTAEDVRQARRIEADMRDEVIFSDSLRWNGPGNAPGHYLEVCKEGDPIVSVVALCICKWTISRAWMEKQGVPLRVILRMANAHAEGRFIGSRPPCGTYLCSGCNSRILLNGLVEANCPKCKADYTKLRLLTALGGVSWEGGNPNQPWLYPDFKCSNCGEVRKMFGKSMLGERLPGIPNDPPLCCDGQPRIKMVGRRIRFEDC